MRYLALAALIACDIPTDYTVRTPECPFPVPMVSDTLTLPLGCPYMLPDSTITGWIPRYTIGGAP